MGRGRRPNLALEPTRALQTQRAFRQRKADHLASLQDTIEQLTEENVRLRQLLRLEPRLAEANPNAENNGCALPPAAGVSLKNSDDPTILETKKQLANAATHVEQQVDCLQHTLKALRSLLQTGPASNNLRGLSSVSEVKELPNQDDHHVSKRARGSHEYTVSNGDPHYTAPSPNGIDRSSNSKYAGMTPTSFQTLTEYHPGNQRPWPTQTASSSATTRTPSWNSPSVSAGSPATSRETYHANGIHSARHLGHSSGSRTPTPMSPMDPTAQHHIQSPSSYPPQQYDASRSHFAHSGSYAHRSEPYYPYPQQQQHSQTYPARLRAESSPSYSATRALALTALQSPSDQQQYAVNECAAVLSPSTRDVPNSTVSTPVRRSDSSEAAPKTACCPGPRRPDGPTMAADHDTGRLTKAVEEAVRVASPVGMQGEARPPSPLGIRVNMKAETPNGEACCFGLVECDDQGRIII